MQEDRSQQLPRAQLPALKLNKTAPMGVVANKERQNHQLLQQSQEPIPQKNLTGGACLPMRQPKEEVERGTHPSAT